MRSYFYSKKHGFTLIELLVVIAIIAILAAILMANFNDAKEQTRNKSIRASLGEAQLAIELYKSQNGRYPATIDLIVPDFIRALPASADSANPSCVLSYTTDASGTYYKYTAANCYAGATTVALGIKPDDEFSRCPSSCSIGAATCAGQAYGSYVSTPAYYSSMAIYSAGGECR